MVSLTWDNIAWNKIYKKMLVIIGAISGIREYLFAKTNLDDNVKPNYRRLFKNRGRFTLLRYH